eukprot:CAMPEP_0171230928 /NCGR_PEP_ID=MMETSP0790-20130122/39645_1 /TAXON_ID=2925 /ORGANISM="Alexandrium catenella, Strain OF101" /LENGTH=235 /DNA_ID=CAMNT_0011697147 /DNA_START=103 /DNA_END=810 /DNA_ORIENTATION=+
MAAKIVRGLSLFGGACAVAASAGQLPDAAVLIQQRATSSLDEGDVPQAKQCADIDARHKAYCGPQSYATFGFNCSGWSGQKCMDMDARCADITSIAVCNTAKDKLGMHCAGWGGSKCVAWDANPNQITSERICGTAAEQLRIPAVGWGGSECLSKDTVKCKSFTREDVCKNSMTRFGVECGGWSGESCLMKADRECRLLKAKHVCVQSNSRMSINCTWQASTSKCFSVNPVMYPQ